MMVRCVDNTMQLEALTVGQVYEVRNAFERDGYYELSGFDTRFSMSRFVRLCKCGADLDKKGVCPALCEPVPQPPPVYTGPTVVGSTHIGRLAQPVRGWIGGRS